jgi:signal transduction histidine kinase
MTVLDQVSRPSDEAQALVDAERLRIARELHDVVAYSFATISVHAGVGAHVADGSSSQAAEALRVIRTISGEASREMGAILGVLRRTAGAGDAPFNGVARLDSLAATIRGAGLPTRVVVLGQPRSLPPTVDRAAYRIVQEALTNVLRHAGPASAAVTVRYERDRLVIEVLDDGRGADRSHGGPAAGGGHGIAGMRERALALGGELDAGSRPTGGFRVRVALPVGVQS